MKFKVIAFIFLLIYSSGYCQTKLDVFSSINLDTLKSTFSEIELLNLRDKDGKTPLMYSLIANKNIEVIKYLSSFKESINTRDINGKSALIYAIINKRDIDIIKILLDNGALTYIQCAEGRSPIIYAAMSNCNNDIIKILLTSSSSSTGYVVLQKGITGFPINIIDKYGKNALMYAIEYSSIEVVKSLLRTNGPGGQGNIDTKDSNGFTPLMIAANVGNIEALDYLLKNNADGTLKNKNDETAFKIALENSKVMTHPIIWKLNDSQYNKPVTQY